MKVFLLVFALISVSLVSCDNSTETDYSEPDDSEPDASESLEMNSDKLIESIKGIDTDKFDLSHIDSDDLALDDSLPVFSEQNDFGANSFDSNAIIGHNGLGEISFGPNGFQRNVFGQNVDFSQLGDGQEQNEFGAGDIARGLFGIQRAEAAVGRFNGGFGPINSNRPTRYDVPLFGKRIRPGDTMQRLFFRYPELRKVFFEFMKDHKRLNSQHQTCRYLPFRARVNCEAKVNYAICRAVLSIVSKLRKQKWGRRDIMDLFLVMNFFPKPVIRILKRLKDWRT